MPITKQQACLLFSYDFKLVDKKGNEWSIHNPLEDYGLSIYPTKGGMHDREIIYSQIGTDYHILAYHHSCLTKEVNEVIPIDSIKDVLHCEGFTDEIKEYVEYWITDPSMHNTMPHVVIEEMNRLHFLPHGIEESNVKYIND